MLVLFSYHFLLLFGDLVRRLLISLLCVCACTRNWIPMLEAKVKILMDRLDHEFATNSSSTSTECSSAANANSGTETLVNATSTSRPKHEESSWSKEAERIQEPESLSPRRSTPPSSSSHSTTVNLAFSIVPDSPGSDH